MKQRLFKDHPDVLPTSRIRGLRPKEKAMGEQPASGARVPCILLLSELSSELEKWLLVTKDSPNTVHNRAVYNAVSVIAYTMAIVRAKFEAQQKDAERTANSVISTEKRVVENDIKQR